MNLTAYCIIVSLATILLSIVSINRLVHMWKGDEGFTSCLISVGLSLIMLIATFTLCITLVTNGDLYISVDGEIIKLICETLVK